MWWAEIGSDQFNGILIIGKWNFHWDWITMKKILAEWPQINWSLKLNQRHDTTRNRAQNKWSCHVPNWISWVAHMVENWVARIISLLPELFWFIKKKQLFFNYEHKIAQECLTCSDAPLLYVEFKYTRYSEAFIENVKSPGSWTAKFGGRAGKRNQETKWIRVNTGTVKSAGDTAVLH